MEKAEPMRASGAEPTGGFRHEMYPYQGETDFLDGALSFIDDAVSTGEHVLVAVPEAREQRLRDVLDEHSTACVSFLDTAALGRNPARLIPAWQEHIAKLAADGTPIRGIGEPAWGGPDEDLVGELRYHEWLLNRAFARTPAWRLLCPYDTSLLQAEVVTAARRCHPMMWHESAGSPNPDYVDEEFVFSPLSASAEALDVLEYTTGDLSAVRAMIMARAEHSGLHGDRLRDLLLAATEVAGNSIRHGGGRGTLRTWTTEISMVCEFHDFGYISDPMAGRVRPNLEQNGGRGLWMVQQVCDLVQIRSVRESGTTIRLHTYTDRS